MSELNNLIDILHERAERNPDKSIFTFLENDFKQENVRTFEQVLYRAKAIAAYLQSRFNPHDRVLLIYQPSVEFNEAFLGCIFAGIIAVPVYPPLNEHYVYKLQTIIHDATPRAILTTEKIAKNLRKLKWLKFISSLPLASKLHLKKLNAYEKLIKWDFNTLSVIKTDLIPSSQHVNWVYPHIDQNSIAFLQYTSGSTALPKGVMVSHGSIINCLDFMQNELELTGINCGVSWLPPYHDMGLIGCILLPVYANFNVVLIPTFDFIKRPFGWLHTITKYGAHVSGAPNFAYEICVKRITEEQKSKLDLSTWKVAFCGAEPIRHKTLEVFAKAFQSTNFHLQSFYPCYGMAETTLMVCGNHYNPDTTVISLDKNELANHRVKQVSPSSEDSYLVVSSGNVGNVDVKIINPDTLRPFGEDEIGEIAIHNNAVTLGYWQNDELTREKFKLKLGEDKEYFRTGDLGFVTRDRLYITGRIKDLIIIRGLKYYPQDIEASVENAHAHIKPGCCVAAMIHDDEEEILAIICEVTDWDEQTVHEITESILRTVAEKHNIEPAVIALIKPKTLHKTTSGKLERYANKRALLDKSLDLVALWQKNTNGKYHL